MKQLDSAQLAATAAAISGDAGALYRVVGSLLDSGIPFESVLFDVLLPTQTDVGSRWQTGDYLIADEHAATATIETVVALLAGSFDQPDSEKHFVVTAAEGDWHSLPPRVVSAYLLHLGWRTTYLGPSIEAADLGTYLASEEPDALILSCSMTTHLLGARNSIKEAHAQGVPVLVGGHGFGPNGEWAGAVGADSWVASPRDIPQRLEEWEPDVTVSEAGAHQAPEVMRRLVQERPAILADSAGRIGGDPGRARLLQEVELLLDGVEVATFLDDRRITDEILEWQRETLTAQGLDHSMVTAALGTALKGIDPSAAGLVA